MSDYIDALTCIISKTTTQVSFYCPRMDYDEFSKIVISAKSTHTLIFDCLTLSNKGTINFGKHISYDISRLSLQQTGDKNYSDWREDKSTFYTIVEQIKKSHIHENLRELSIKKCNIDSDDVDLPGVKIVQEVWLL